MNLPVEVIDAVRERRALLFLGNRALVEAGGAPQQKDLAKALGWRQLGSAGTRLAAPSLFDAAGDFEAQHGRDALVAFVRERTDIAGSTAMYRLALRYFPTIFTTARDGLLWKAADELGLRIDVGARDSTIPEPATEARVIVPWWGRFADPGSLVLTRPDRLRLMVSETVRTRVRSMLRKEVVLFVGYRPDESELEVLWDELTLCYGGELPRCHLAVAQGRIDDYLWQKWVWRGLLLFTADPEECMQEIARQMDDGAVS